MSEYVQIGLKMNDADCIKSALKELGYVFEEHEVAQNLHGYTGDVRSQKANIIVRRQNVGAASNDIGFVKNDKGYYDMIISEYDQRAAGAKKIREELQQTYAKFKVMKQAKKMGYRLKSTKVDENGRMKIKVMGR